MVEGDKSQNYRILSYEMPGNNTNGKTGSTKSFFVSKENTNFSTIKLLVMITVCDILERKPEVFNFVEPGVLIIEALTMLSSVNLSYLVVMDKNNEYKGIFCERDYCRNVVLKGRSSRDTEVREVMTIDLPVVQLDDTAEHCMNTMNLYKTRYLLAYDEDQFRGVITIHDLLRQVLANKEAVFDHSLAEQLIDQDEGGKIY
jgi:signal-transduction protein with cAMP-binding, CBS, and nucleotidyltransferase domain